MTESLFRRLGYPNKGAYFSSDHFKELRSEFLENNPTCKNCAAKATTLYFIDYSLSNLSGDSYEGIIPLCHDCQVKSSTAINKADKWVKNFNKSGKKRRW